MGVLLEACGVEGVLSGMVEEEWSTGVEVLALREWALGRPRMKSSESLDSSSAAARGVRESAGVESETEENIS